MYGRSCGLRITLGFSKIVVVGVSVRGLAAVIFGFQTSRVTVKTLCEYEDFEDFVNASGTIIYAVIRDFRGLTSHRVHVHRLAVRGARVATC